MTFSFMLYETAVIVCVILSAFFSGSETALVSANAMTLESFAIKGSRSARRSLALIKRMEEAISIILIGNNIVNTTAAAFLTYIAAEYFYLKQMQLVILISVQTLIFLLFCELFPKVFARSKPELFLMLFSLPLQLFLAILRPLARVSLTFSLLLKRILNVQKVNDSRVKREEIDILFKIGGEAGIIVGNNLMYVSEILHIKNTVAAEIMTPTIDIISVEINSSIKNLIATIARIRFTRIPVYHERVDNIVGYVFYRDLLAAGTGNVKKLSDIIHKAHYVPETKSIYDLHLEMQENLLPLVFIINEYGAVVGMVSYEDIAEEVVGEIHAKDQSKEDLIRQISGKKFIVRGDLEIDHFVRQFPMDIEKRGFKTISGFIMYSMGKVPKKGDRFDYGNYTIIIDEATERSVEKVLVIIQDVNKVRKITRRASDRDRPDRP